MGKPSTFKSYFDRNPIKSWTFRGVYAVYEENLGRDADICARLTKDLDDVDLSKRGAAEKLNEIREDLKFFQDHQANAANRPLFVNNVYGDNNEAYNGSANVTNIYEGVGEKRKAEDGDDIASVKKGKHTYQFLPAKVDLKVNDNSPRLQSNDRTKVDSHFVVGLRSVDLQSTSASALIEQELAANVDAQQALVCLKGHKSAFDYITNAIKCSWDDFGNFLEVTIPNAELNKGEKNNIRLVRCILTDFHANCMKPLYTVRTNERTPFAEHVLPVLKCFGALTNLVDFLWCEIGSSLQKRLLDGIGYDASKFERILVECSGETDEAHTEEDTLKLMECSHHCLKVEMKKCQSASWSTFMRRRVLSIQCVVDKITLMSTSILPSGKWSFVEVRSAEVPLDYESRFSWKKVFELLFKMKELLEEQNDVTGLLAREHDGEEDVKTEDTVFANMSRIATSSSSS